MACAGVKNRTIHMKAKIWQPEQLYTFSTLLWGLKALLKKVCLLKRKVSFLCRLPLTKLHWIIPLSDSDFFNPKEIVYFYLKKSICIALFIYLLQSTRPIRWIRPKEWIFVLFTIEIFLSIYKKKLHTTFTFQQDPDEPGGTAMRIHICRTTLYIQGSAPQPTFCPAVTSRSGSRDCRSLSAYLYATVSLQECSRN